MRRRRHGGRRGGRRGRGRAGVSGEASVDVAQARRRSPERERRRLRACAQIEDVDCSSVLHEEIIALERRGPRENATVLEARDVPARCADHLDRSGAPPDGDQPTADGERRLLLRRRANRRTEERCARSRDGTRASVRTHAPEALLVDVAVPEAGRALERAGRAAGNGARVARGAAAQRDRQRRPRRQPLPVRARARARHAAGEPRRHTPRAAAPRTRSS